MWTQIHIEGIREDVRIITFSLADSLQSTHFADTLKELLNILGNTVTEFCVELGEKT